MAKKKTIYNVIIIICLLVFIVSAIFLGKTLLEYKTGRDEYKKIVLENIVEETEDPMGRMIDWKNLKEINSDTVGWIYIPGTIIDYPVVQGKDNEHYLTHTFQANDNRLGAIFMDSLNDKEINDDNTIIYGHHMRDGSMFKAITEYKKQEFYDEHKFIYFYTPTQTLKIQVFSSFTSNAEDPYTTIIMANKKIELLNKFVSRSNINTDVQIIEEDKIFSLSTCTYDYDDARFVVQGKIVDRVKRFI